MVTPTSNLARLLHGAISTGRLEAGDFKLHDVDSVDGKGLDILTRAIFISASKIAKVEMLAATFKAHTSQELGPSGLNTLELNHRLAALVREVWASNGWLQGYAILTEAAPDAGLHLRMIEDVRLASAVYSRLSTGYRRRKCIDVKMTIRPSLFYDSVIRIGPKSRDGGN